MAGSRPLRPSASSHVENGRRLWLCELPDRFRAVVSPGRQKKIESCGPHNSRHTSYLKMPTKQELDVVRDLSEMKRSGHMSKRLYVGFSYRRLAESYEALCGMNETDIVAFLTPLVSVAAYEGFNCALELIHRIFDMPELPSYEVYKTITDEYTQFLEKEHALTLAQTCWSVPSIGEAYPSEKLNALCINCMLNVLYVYEHRENEELMKSATKEKREEEQIKNAALRVKTALELEVIRDTFGIINPDTAVQNENIPLMLYLNTAGPRLKDFEVGVGVKGVCPNFSQSSDLPYGGSRNAKGEILIRCEPWCNSGCLNKYVLKKSTPSFQSVVEAQTEIDIYREGVEKEVAEIIVACRDRIKADVKCGMLEWGVCNDGCVNGYEFVYRRCPFKNRYAYCMGFDSYEDLLAQDRTGAVVGKNGLWKWAVRCSEEWRQFGDLVKEIKKELA